MAFQWSRVRGASSVSVKWCSSVLNSLNTRTLCTRHSGLGSRQQSQKKLLNTGNVMSPWLHMVSGLDSSRSDYGQSIGQQKCQFSQTSTKRVTKPDLSKAIELAQGLKHISGSPGPALALGMAGLIPFIVMPASMLLSGQFVASLAFTNVAYGACILSWLGAVRWGMALSDDAVVEPNWFNLGYSVTPALMAWMVLMLPNPLSIMALMGALAGVTYMDMTLLGYPPWFKALRFLLSLVAILSLWTTLMCMLLLTDSKKKKEQLQKLSQKPAPAVVAKCEDEEAK